MRAKAAFEKWIEFMNNTIAINTTSGMSSDDIKEFRELIKAEIAQMEKDEANFFMG